MNKIIPVRQFLIEITGDGTDYFRYYSIFKGD